MNPLFWDLPIGNLISILDFGTVPHSLRNLGFTQFVLSFADFIV